MDVPGQKKSQDAKKMSNDIPSVNDVNSLTIHWSVECMMHLTSSSSAKKKYSRKKFHFQKIIFLATT